MGKWKYDLGNTGRTLRKSAVSGEPDCARIIEQVRVCCSDVLQQLSGDDIRKFYSTFSNFAEYLDRDIEMIRNGDDVSVYGFDNYIDMTNARMDRFCELCDDARVWISI